MLGMPESYVKSQFYSSTELERATNSSYKDYDKEILLPGNEMEHVLTCVYPNIPEELNLPEVANQIYFKASIYMVRLYGTI